jgi:hypothetical protein
VQGNIGQLSVNGGPYLGVKEPQGTLLFEPGVAAIRRCTAAEQALRLAESQRQAAADELQVHTDQALREVALAYDQVETGTHQRCGAAFATGEPTSSTDFATGTPR